MRDVLLIIHILAGATWIGGSMTARFMGGELRRAGHDAGSGFAAAFQKMRKVYYPPAAIVILLTGILLVLDSEVHGFDDVFVALGIAVVLAGAFLGIRVFDPIVERAQEAHADGDDVALDRIYRRFNAFGTLDIALLAFAVVVMVLKPGI